MAAKVKLTLYFPEELLKEAQNEAVRQDRSVSWIVQHAGKIGRWRIGEYPSIEQLVEPLAR